MNYYLSTAEANDLLHDRYTVRTLWLGLCTSEPGELFDPTTEVFGGGYVRQRILFGQPSGRSVSSTNAQTFSGMPSSTILWVVVMSDQFTTDSMVAALQQDDAESVPSGGVYLSAPGDIVISF